METVVRVSAGIRADSGAWFRQNGELAGVVETALHDELVRRDGQPEAAHFAPDSDPYVLGLAVQREYGRSLQLDGRGGRRVVVR